MKKFLKIKNMRGANKKPLRAGGTERGLRPAHDSEQFARAAGMGKEGIPARTEAVVSFKVYEDSVEYVGHSRADGGGCFDLRRTAPAADLPDLRMDRKGAASGSR